MNIEPKTNKLKLQITLNHKKHQLIIHIVILLNNADSSLQNTLNWVKLDFLCNFKGLIVFCLFQREKRHCQIRRLHPEEPPAKKQRPDFLEDHMYSLSPSGHESEYNQNGVSEEMTPI